MHPFVLILGCYLGLIGVVRPEPSAVISLPKNRELAREELKKLQGTWERLSMVLEGKEVPDGDLKTWVAIYEDDTLTLKVDGKVYRRAIVTLDPSKTPKSINTWDADGGFADQTLSGIYELDGNLLRMCIAKPGEKRPTEFTTERGTGFIYCLYRRQGTGAVPARSEASDSTAKETPAK